MTARIEIRSRDITFMPNIPGIGMAQHGYFIEIGENDQPIHILRAGPEREGLPGSAFSNIVVDFVAYNGAITGRAASDYITDPSKYRAAVIFYGSPELVRTYFNKLWEYGKIVNDGKHDYKYPLCDLVAAPIPCTDCNQQNSNAFLTKAMEHAGIPVRYPTYPDGTTVWMPGAKSDIRDSLVDHIIGYGGKYVDIALDKAIEIFKDTDFHTKHFTPAMIGQYYDDFVRSHNTKSVRESIQSLRASHDASVIEAQQKPVQYTAPVSSAPPAVHVMPHVPPSAPTHVEQAPYISQEAMHAGQAAAAAAATFHNNAGQGNFHNPIPTHYVPNDVGNLVNIVVPQNVPVPQQDFSNIHVMEAINVPLGYNGPYNFH